MVAFVQGAPVAAMEEEHERRRAGRMGRTMEAKSLLQSGAIAQVVDTRKALAGSRRAGGVPLQGLLKVGDRDTGGEMLLQQRGRLLAPGKRHRASSPHDSPAIPHPSR